MPKGENARSPGTWIIDQRHLPIVHEIERSSDRAKAIVSAAFIDEEIKEQIQSRLRNDKTTINKLFKGSGPLGSFSARIDMAYLMGIF